MGIFTLLVALGSTINDTINERKKEKHILEEKRRYEDIDFNNIDYVAFDGTETAYRIETKEEFDIVATNFLSDMDGWPHYETTPVEYEVENGENYCFTIKYKDGTKIYRSFHETSPLTNKLLEYCNKDEDESYNNAEECFEFEISYIDNSSEEKPLRTIKLTAQDLQEDSEKDKMCADFINGLKNTVEALNDEYSSSLDDIKTK